MYSSEKSYKWIWAWILCLLAGLLVIVGIGTYVLFGFNRFSLDLNIAGEQEITLDYGDTYEELGVKPHFGGSRFWKEGFDPETEVSVAGSVNTAKTGTYEITYATDYYLWHTEVTRTVHVVDRKDPVLTLNGEPELYIFPGETYEEMGFTASDEYDGDLTGKVQQSEEDGIITYWVSDAAGNRVEATRIVHYDDSVPPVITLTEGENLELYLGTKYSEPGFTASDNSEGDITDRVTYEGTINPYLRDPQTITYTVTDIYGNTTTVKRTVTMIPNPDQPKVQPEGKVIYLTFDDGPSQYTQQLLDVLDKYDVKVTFFVTLNGDPEIFKAMAEAGHAIGIHTATHNYRKIYGSEAAFFEDINKVQEMIVAQTGEETRLLRFPGGSSNTVSNFNPGIMSRLTKLVEDAGFEYFDWNVDSYDAGGASSPDEVYRNVVNGCSGSKFSIVLQHDIKGFSVRAVESIIVWGLENGYTFLPLDVTTPCVHHRINN